MDQVRPAFHDIRSQEANVSIKTGKLCLVHGLDEVATRSTGRSLADFLVNVCELLVGAKALEDDATRAFPWFAILGKENVLDVEDIEKTQSAPRLERYLPVHKLATPTGAKASRALVEMDEATICQLVLLKRGKKRVSVHQEHNKQAYNKEKLQAAVYSAQFEGYEAQHGQAWDWEGVGR